MANAMIYMARGLVRKGEIVTIKAMISHPMETGYRRDERGAAIARNIIRRFSCTYEGEEVIAVDLHPAISANPFFAFTLVAARSGPVSFVWSGDNGFEHRETAMLSVQD